MWRLLVGCSGVATVGEADDSAGVVTEFCADAPALTWDTFGQGFLIAQCDGCHASTSPDRHEAPLEVVFDSTYARDCLTVWVRGWSRIIGMKPLAGPTPYPCCWR